MRNRLKQTQSSNIANALSLFPVQQIQLMAFAQRTTNSQADSHELLRTAPKYHLNAGIDKWCGGDFALVIYSFTGRMDRNELHS